MITTTLNIIKEHRPCASGWYTLLKSLGKKQPDDDALPLEYILDSNGLEHALWVTWHIKEYNQQISILALTYAGMCLPLIKDDEISPVIYRAMAAGIDALDGRVSQQVLDQHGTYIKNLMESGCSSTFWWSLKALRQALNQTAYARAAAAADSMLRASRLVGVDNTTEATMEFRRFCRLEGSYAV